MEKLILEKVDKMLSQGVKVERPSCLGVINYYKIGEISVFGCDFSCTIFIGGNHITNMDNDFCYNLFKKLRKIYLESFKIEYDKKQEEINKKAIEILNNI